MSPSQESRPRLAMNLESVIVRTIDGTINAWDGCAAEFYGWKKEEAIGRVSHDLFQTQFPVPLEEIQSELLRKGLWEGKLVHRTRDGGQVVVESRWSLDLTGPSHVVFEINRPSDPQDGAGPRAILSMQVVASSRHDRVADAQVLVERMAKAADVFLIAAGAVATFMTLYVIYYYSGAGERELPGISSRLLYSVPAGLAVLLFAATRLRPNEKVNVTLAILACAVTLYATEGFLEIIDARSRPIWDVEGLTKEKKQEISVKVARQFGIRLDTRDRIEVIADLSKRGLQAVPAILPRVLLVARQNGETIREPNDLPLKLDGGTKSAIEIGGKEVIPLGGVAKKLTVMCNESGQWITYTSDEHGFSNPEGIWQSGPIDVAAVGDSFTQGYCVPPDKSFVGVIRRQYPATLNLGMAANGPLYELASLREYLPALKPKVVLWCYFEGNDLPELQVENKSALLMHYLNAEFSQRLLTKQADIDAALIRYIQAEAKKQLSKPAPTAESRVYEAAVNVIKLSALRTRLGLAYARTPEENVLATDVRGPGMTLFRQVLSQAKSDVDTWGGTLYFVYLPSWERYANHLNMGEDQRDEVLRVVRSLGIPLIDADAAFRAQPDVMSLFPFRGSGHYNENGHKIVGERILKVLSRFSPANRDAGSS